ncbi:MAG: hypothetical protein IPH81_20360 [Candidatus Microthrix sp.]|nr:hypothetical protein [Candidatus Microthrix sp.]
MTESSALEADDAGDGHVGRGDAEMIRCSRPMSWAVASTRPGRSAHTRARRQHR